MQSSDLVHTRSSCCDMIYQGHKPFKVYSKRWLSISHIAFIDQTSEVCHQSEMAHTLLRQFEARVTGYPKRTRHMRTFPP